MIRPEEALADLQPSPRVRLALGVAAARMLKASEVVVQRGHFAGGFTSGGKDKSHCALIDALGFVESPQFLVQDAEIIEHGSHFDIAGPEHAFHELERTLEEMLGASIVSPGLGRPRQVVSDARDESGNRAAGVEERSPAVRRCGLAMDSRSAACWITVAYHPSSAERHVRYLGSRTSVSLWLAAILASLSAGYRIATTAATPYSIRMSRFIASPPFLSFRYDSHSATFALTIDVHRHYRS